MTYAIYILVILVAGYFFGLIASIAILVVGVLVIYVTRRRSASHILPLVASSLFRTGDSQLDDYLSAITSRLSDKGFHIERDVLADQQKLFVFATQSRFELSKIGMVRRIVAVVGVDNVNKGKVEGLVDSVKKFSSENSLASAMANQSNFLYVVIVAREVGEDMKEWVKGLVGKRNWMSYSLPVLVSLSERKIYHSTKTPMFGSLLYSGLRKFADENFAFWSLPSSQV